MPRLHRLTPAGIERFQKFLDSQKAVEAEVFNAEMLFDPSCAEIAGSGPEVPLECKVQTRLDAVVLVDSIISTAELDDPVLDRGVWCWLSWLWFDSLCPTSESGQRDPKGSARWVLNLEYTRYYRHLLAGPWYVYNAHRDNPERALALLLASVNRHSELFEQIASSQERVSNPGLIEMVTRLYYDPLGKKLRRGHGDKKNGGPRRLVKVVRQLDMVWDLYSMSADQFLSLLPSEFDRFKSVGAGAS